MERVLPNRRKRPENGWQMKTLSGNATRVLDQQRDYWPLSVRQIHYRLLSLPQFARNLQTGVPYLMTREAMPRFAMCSFAPES